MRSQIDAIRKKKNICKQQKECGTCELNDDIVSELRTIN